MNKYFKEETEQLEPVPITDELLQELLNGEYGFNRFQFKNNKFFLDDIEIKLVVKMTKVAERFWNETKSNVYNR